jgi:predicted RNase H-like HicB family nuclease
MSAIQRPAENDMKQFVAIIEKCPDTGLYVGHVPGFPGAHSQGSTLEELNANMQEVLAMLLEDDVQPESEFVGTQLISVH